MNATPDVVLRDTRGKHPLLVEVKYKPAEGLPDRSALNQAISYGAAYDASHLVIAQPRRAGSMIGSRLRQVGVVGELTVHQYIFDLAAQDLGQEEDSWIESIRRLASSVTAGQFGTQNGQSVNTPV